VPDEMLDNVRKITLTTCAWDLIILLLFSFSSSLFKSKVYRKRRQAFNTNAACCERQNQH